MTDLEMTRLCAEAMPEWHPDSADPLHDDAQAMALVKKFHLYIDGLLTHDWTVALTRGAFSYEALHKDLNRAIVEVIAKMQAGKQEAMK